MKTAELKKKLQHLKSIEYSTTTFGSYGNDYIRKLSINTDKEVELEVVKKDRIAEMNGYPPKPEKHKACYSVEDLIKEIEEIHIEYWDDHYHETARDGYSWSLIFSFYDGIPDLKYTGSNAQPNELGEMVHLLSYDKEMEKSYKRGESAGRMEILDTLIDSKLIDDYQISKTFGICGNDLEKRRTIIFQKRIRKQLDQIKSISLRIYDAATGENVADEIKIGFDGYLLQIHKAKNGEFQKNSNAPFSKEELISDLKELHMEEWETAYNLGSQNQNINSDWQIDIHFYDKENSINEPSELVIRGNSPDYPVHFDDLRRILSFDERSSLAYARGMKADRKEILDRLLESKLSDKEIAHVLGIGIPDILNRRRELKTETEG